MKSVETRPFEYRSDAVPALQAEAISAVRDGADVVVLDLDSIAHLDSEAVRGLITLLRRTREAGGDVALRVTRDDIRRSLAVTALDRIFPLQGAAA